MSPITVWLAALVLQAPAEAPRPPNVVLVVTDDQGYGDIAAHGNRMVATPALDRLHAQSVRLVDFHVDPTCSPTRAALMTGRYSYRTGVWHTVMGRSILRRDETTMAELFRAAGYRTAIFGKWHLGDSYPYRPQDRGFDEVLIHGGGGVGQAPDYWGNDYFDDTYFHNGKPEKQQGYCTDVWFAAATRFIESQRRRPFFVYLATNAPHSPYLVDPRYAQPYKDKGVPAAMADFYGMIANFDENLGRLRARLAEWGLERDTLFVFMTDNGTAAGAPRPGRRPNTAGWQGFNAGMRGQKGSQYDGGHRAPCFLHWPAGGLVGPRDVGGLAAHLDLLPTLAAACGLKQPAGVAWDGQSLLPRLGGEPPADRTLFVHVHRVERPEPWRLSAVLTPRWRLVDGKELYDIAADPGQTKDLAAEQPQVVAALRQRYESHWRDVSTRFDEYCPLVLGDAAENPVELCAHDWHAPANRPIPWDQAAIRRLPWSNGFWAVEIARAGRYRFRLRHQPAVAPLPLSAVSAKVKIGNAESQVAVPAGATHADIELDLAAGPAELQTWLTDAAGQSRGAFYLEVLRKD